VLVANKNAHINQQSHGDALGHPAGHRLSGLLLEIAKALLAPASGVGDSWACCIVGEQSTLG